ncbi:Uncharacterized protein APZ42_023177 [Daphnia magna]|uniref:Uncharacterized protein n=1 Tax=Daphnia magna TaxID=35525 RepID=A0A164V5G7_9CRUS|nr:Uncharacterized protein APZ42_023177 [Daphnia magna]
MLTPVCKPRPLISDCSMMLFRVVSLGMFVFLASPHQCYQEGRIKESGGRLKRSVILLPANTSITVTFDLSMPVRALASQAGFYNMRVPFRFFIPTYDQLTSFYTESREDDGNQIDQIHRQEQERANDERRFIYRSMESLLSSFGIDGMACVQRAICELSEAPIGHNDLLGNTLSLLLTPPKVADFGKWILGNRDATGSHKMDQEECIACEVIDESYEDEYVKAYHHGKQGDCLHRYGSACPISFFSIFNL